MASQKAETIVLVKGMKRDYLFLAGVLIVSASLTAAQILSIIRNFL